MISDINIAFDRSYPETHIGSIDHKFTWIHKSVPSWLKNPIEHDLRTFVGCCVARKHSYCGLGNIKWKKMMPTDTLTAADK